MKIWNIPIESLEERYSKNWNEWFPREFKKLNVKFETIEGEFLTDKINIGSFLDVYSTNYFKTSQLMVLIKRLYGKSGIKDVPPFFCDFWSPCLEMLQDIKHIKQRNIKDGDVLFFHDLWFPGIEALQYIRQGAGIDFKIVGFQKNTFSFSNFYHFSITNPVGNRNNYFVGSH